MESIYRVSPLVAFVLGLVMTIVVIRQKPRSPLHRTFSLFLASMALWGLTIFGMRTSPTLVQALPWEKATVAVLPLVSVSFFHFVQLFTGSRGRRSIVAFGYLFAIVVAAISPTGLLVREMQPMWYGHGFVGGPLLLPYAAVFYGMVSAGIYQLARYSRTADSEVDRNRSAYLALGGVIAIFGLLTDVLASGGVRIYPLGIIGNILLTLINTYAILKYHLLDVYVVIRKGAAYAIVSAVGVGLVIGILSSMYALGLGAWRLATWQNAILVMLIASCLQPVLHVVQTRVDRWFDRGRYDYLRAIEGLGERTKAIIDLKYISESLVNTVAVAVKTDRVCVLLPDSEELDFVSIAGRMLPGPPAVRLAGHSMLVWWLRERQDILTRKEIETIPQFQALTEREKELLRELQAEVFVPMATREGLRGILVLGRKLSDQEYSNDETSMLRVVARQMATTLDNARMYQLKDRRYHEQALLTRLSTIVSSELDLNVVYRSFITEIGAVLPLDFASITLEEAQGASPRTVFSWAAMPGLQLPSVLPADASRVGGDRAHETGLSIGEEETGRNVSQSGEIRSVARHALQSKTGDVGHLTLASCLPDSYTDDNQRLLKQIAFQLSIAIDNSRLYDLERKARQELEKEFKQRTEFVDALIHEVKTPITAMLASSELLKEELSPGPSILGDLAANLDVSVRNLNRRISELVEFVRLQNTEIRVKPVSVPVRKLAEEAAANVSALLLTKRQELKVHVDPGLGHVLADPERISQVLLNLFTNSAKFSGPETLIHMRVFPKKGDVVFELRDQAPPLTPEESERLFSPYQRGQHRGGGGLGLGLFICKKLVLLHGGTIWVETDKAGNRFYFSLPAGPDGEE